jgi:alpha-D-xyloside xylohydrolase
MPYLAEVSRDVAVRGLPMMRPLPLALPGDMTARAAAHREYLLGDDVLVAPVLEPGGRVTLWVPPGKWEGLDGGPALDGPAWQTAQLGLDQVPAWSRPGIQVLT